MICSDLGTEMKQRINNTMLYKYIRTNKLVRDFYKISKAVCTSLNYNLTPSLD